MFVLIPRRHKRVSSLDDIPYARNVPRQKEDYFNEFIKPAAQTMRNSDRLRIICAPYASGWILDDFLIRLPL